MALVDIQTGRGRKKFVEFVVVGDDARGCKKGDIRWVWWDRSKSSPLLKIGWINEERTAVNEVRVAAEYLKRGWTLLRDMYESEKRMDLFGDFQAFAQEQIENPIGMTGREFPEDRLPKALQDIRSAAREHEAKAKAFKFPSDGKALESEDDVTVEDGPQSDDEPALPAQVAEASKPESRPRGRKRS